MRRQLLIPAVPALVVALAIVSLSAPEATAQRDRDAVMALLRQIQAQLSQIQSSHATLKRAVDELTAASAAQQDSLRKTLADGNVALERVEQDLSVLSAQIDETNGRIGNLQQEVASMRQNQQPLLLPIETADGEGEASAQSPDDAPPVVAAGPSVADIYNQARIDYTQGRYALAISGFRDVLDSDPRGDLADNAHYWVGESYFAQRQYERAIASFDTVVRDYPDSNKRSDAYLKKAMSLENMDRRAEAMLMYELVIEQFPRTQHQRIARSRLEGLMRTTPPR